jgi:hypothetical protein
MIIQSGWHATGPAYGVLTFTDRDVSKLGKSQSWGPDSPYKYITQPVTLYPLDSVDLYIPDDIQPDWLEGLIEFLLFALDLLKDHPEYRDGNGNLLDEETRDRWFAIVYKYLGKALAIENSREKVEK